MIDKINTLENEIKTLQRTILYVMPYKAEEEKFPKSMRDNNRAEMIAEITKIIEIKQKEIKNQLMQD
jgi:hypothetical protein